MILADQPVAPSELWHAWTVEPAVVLSLAAAAALYARGAARVRRHHRHPRRAIAYYAGLGIVAVALVSPVDAAATALFSAHMVQHLLLMVVAAPLLAYAKPTAALLAGLPSRARVAAHQVGRGALQRTARLVVHPVVVWTIGAVALWGWHLPKLYQLALAHDWLHALEHASFLGSALLFWSLVLGSGTRRGLPRPIAALLVVATGVQSTALGAVLLFATRPLYPVHAAGAAAWHTSALTDQQLAGALMWGPPALLFAVVLGWLLVRWFKEMDDPRYDLRLVALGEPS